LNFYSFRKIKYGDSIRIDVETEKRTANYWRFKHEHFRQGRPDLLSEIKRMNGKVTSSGETISTTPSPSNAVPATVLSSTCTKLVPNTAQASIQVADKSEVLKLKKRIDEMTKNIDKLTEMVQKVTLQQELSEADQSVVIEPGSKRKKSPPQLEDTERNTAMIGVVDFPMPDEAFSTSMMDIEDIMSSIPSPDTTSSSDSQIPPTIPLSRESSNCSTENEFVDQLFTAFNEDDGVLDWFASQSTNENDVDDLDEFFVPNNNTNRPDPNLMQRLSDALQLLPRDIQELIVNRLIEAITSTEGFTVAATATPQAVTSAPTKSIVVEQPKKSTYVANSKSLPEQQQPIQPLAAATLAALLHHYSNQIKAGSQQQLQKRQEDDEVAAAAAASSESKKNIKPLPVIPVHA
jgi:hypothetical protein